MRLLSWLLAPLLLAAAWCAQVYGIDLAVEDRFFDLDTQHFVLQQHPLAERLLHDGGQWLIVTVAIAILFLLVLSMFVEAYRHWRGDCAHVLLCMVLTTGGVAAIKRASPIDCPSKIERYGGDRPHRGLAQWFEGASDAKARGHCFPGGHSSGAFGLLALAFVARRHRAASGGWVGAGVVLLGAGFALTQWARGAHFVSHDLASAAIAWAICLASDRIRHRAARQAQQHAHAGSVVFERAAAIVQQRHRPYQ